MMNEEKTRLDLYVGKTEGLSRSNAQELIKNGFVDLNGKKIYKPSAPVENGDTVVVTAGGIKYSGRGGFKLEKALSEFGIPLIGLICLDVGASTGGFTDCMLQNGAKKVYAVENGTGQLSERLRNDSRVISMENMDIRDLGSLPDVVEFVAVDVSFISLIKVLPQICNLLKDGSSAVFLVKPQFEAGKGNIGRNGLVNDKKLHRKILERILLTAKEVSFTAIGLTHSPLMGKDNGGNIEYLMYCKKGLETAPLGRKNIISVTDDAFSMRRAL